MLKIHNPFDPSEVLPFPIEDNKRYVTHKQNGLDVLTFEIQGNDPLYRYVAEETLIEDEKNRFVVKSIDEHSDFVTVTCDLDLDDWKRDIIYEFRTTNKTLSDVIAMILPSGWKAVGAEGFSQRTTVEGSEGKPLLAATPFQVLEKASEAYSCVFNFDVLGKTVTAIDPSSFRPSGQFFTDEINLKNLGFVGSSEGFATRLYAYGKKDEDGNPMTFADINAGKPYVEDYSYSSKIVSVGWSDERYTNPESLLEAAKERLKQISHPSRSYECDAQNLGENVWLYKVVTLIDRRRRTRVNHQIVEYKECPDHSLDTIVLSKVVPGIKTVMNKTESGLKEDIQKESELIQQSVQQSMEQQATQIQEDVDAAIDDATAKITGNKGGNFVWVFDADGKPVELLNLADSMDLNEAKSVWRWNSSGLGHSNDGYNGAMTLALLPDGAINASAITAGILTASLIRAGQITDVNGVNVWDLETGEFRLSASTKIADGDAESSLKDAMSGAADAALTHESVFNALTKDGTLKGIYRTADGELYINATYLASGILASAGEDKCFYLDLDKGILNMKASQFSIGGKTVQDIAGEAEDNAVGQALDLIKAQTQEDIFNKLTNNGAAKGIELVNGELYINATYLASGVISSAGGKLKIDLLNESIPVFNTGISTNGLAVRADGFSTADLFSFKAFEAQIADGYYGQMLLRSFDGKVIFRLTELFNPEFTEKVGVGSYWVDYQDALRTIISSSSDHAGITLQQKDASAPEHEYTSNGTFWLGADGVSRLNTMEINGKRVSWRDNGDGTSTLIGQ